MLDKQLTPYYPHLANQAPHSLGPIQRPSSLRKRQDDTHNETPPDRRRRIRNCLRYTFAHCLRRGIPAWLWWRPTHYLLVKRYAQKLVRHRPRSRCAARTPDQRLSLRPRQYLGNRSSRPLGRSWLSRGVHHWWPSWPASTTTGTDGYLLLKRHAQKLV